MGCVAKTSGSLIGIVFILTVACPTHLVHEPKAPLQVASFPIRYHPIVPAVVSAISPQLPQLGGNDAGAGSDSRLVRRCTDGYKLMPPNWRSDADPT